MSAATPFELAVTVTPADIDVLGHVNNVTYLRWVQEVAAAHWRALAPAEEQDRIAWVVLRHEIDYEKAALLGDELVARTWVGTSRRLSFERHTEILRAKDRQLLARARSVWCPIDVRTRRPRQVSAALRELFSASDEAPGPV